MQELYVLRYIELNIKKTSQESVKIRGNQKFNANLVKTKSDFCPQARNYLR